MGRERDVEREGCGEKEREREIEIWQRREASAAVYNGS